MKIYFYLVFLLLVGPCSVSMAWDAKNPDDPSAHSAAINALVKLGPNKGARELHLDIRVVMMEGRPLAEWKMDLHSSGRSLVADVEQVNQAIKDLNADVREKEIRVEISSDVLFDFDKSNLKPEAIKELEKVALIIRSKGISVKILGHTDSKGNDDYNQKLSEKRAQSVKEWFVNQGQIEKEKMSTEGLGESQPVAQNTNADGSDNPEGRTKNRRVEIIIKTAS